MPYNGKIFGIGLSKTGTTSLGAALQVLGYKTKDFPSIRYIPHALLYIKDHNLNNYDAFTDIPVIPFYKKLDKKYPGSKFIYTTREKESWLRSCQRYPRFHIPLYRLPFKIIKLRQTIYKTYRFDYEKFDQAYDRHHQDVLNYFKLRPQDLLVLDINEENKWGKICQFLNHPVPDRKFPFRNSRKYNYDDNVERYHKYFKS